MLGEFGSIDPTRVSFRGVSYIIDPGHATSPCEHGNRIYVHSEDEIPIFPGTMNDDSAAPGEGPDA